MVFFFCFCDKKWYTRYRKYGGMMSNSDIFKKTFPFVKIRFGLYLLLSLGIGVVFMILMRMLSIVESESVLWYVGICSFLICIIVYMLINEYLNYLVKSAHVAVIGELVEKGNVPVGTSIVTYGKELVKQRFTTASIFYVFDILISFAISRIQNLINKFGEKFEKIPILNIIVSFVSLILTFFLRSVDEAVLCHVFRKKNENVWKSAADGIVLYFENWKEIFKSVIFLSMVVLVLCFAEICISVYIFIMIINATMIANWPILLLLMFVAVVINAFNSSFIDSWITISIINKYTELTLNQEPQFDLYSKASGCSRMFRKICDKAEFASMSTSSCEVSSGVIKGNTTLANMVSNQNVVQTQTNQSLQSQVDLNKQSLELENNVQSSVVGTQHSELSQTSDVINNVNSNNNF